jgi:hypothetical protein
MKPAHLPAATAAESPLPPRRSGILLEGCEIDALPLLPEGPDVAMPGVAGAAVTLPVG